MFVICIYIYSKESQNRAKHIVSLEVGFKIE